MLLAYLLHSGPRYLTKRSNSSGGEALSSEMTFKKLLFHARNAPGSSVKVNSIVSNNSFFRRKLENSP